MNSRKKIAMLLDYGPGNRFHDASLAALDGEGVAVTWLHTSDAAAVSGYDALFFGPGSPYVNVDGALAAVRWARESGAPFFAT